MPPALAKTCLLFCFAGLALVLLTGVDAESRDVGGVTETDASVAAYFGKVVARHRALTRGAFDDLVLAGRPFVVEDGGAGQPFVGWTCDRFRKEFPNARVFAQHAAGNEVRPITDRWEHLELPLAEQPGGPRLAAWYWGVKGADSDEEEERASIFAEGSENPLPRVRSQIVLPAFMSQTRQNRGEVMGSPEFWFSAPSAGAAMHMDQHCESTLAIQLSGTRRWRLGWAPPVPNGTLYKEGTYSDGALSGKGYTPPLEVVVSEGEALFIPAAFLHETTNIGDSCAASLTFQFREPLPAAYFRRSLRDLRRTGDFHECWGMLGRLAGGGMNNSPKMAKFDRDADGRFAASEADSPEERAAHAFHDADGDGVVSEAELRQGWTAWQDANAEATKAKTLRPKSFSHTAISSGRPEL